VNIVLRPTDLAPGFKNLTLEQVSTYHFNDPCKRAILTAETVLYIPWDASLVKVLKSQCTGSLVYLRRDDVVIHALVSLGTEGWSPRSVEPPFSDVAVGHTGSGNPDDMQERFK
jgi:hypothetical protein